MINVDETNQFQVQPFIYLEKYDIDVINNVYVEIIGVTATKLYFYLNSLRQPSRYGQFAYDTNLNLAQIVDAIKKLEQVELIRSLKRSDRIIHIVQKPNNIVQLLNNPNYIDVLSVENVARNFDINNDNSEITISYFQTQENEIDDFLNNYLLENNVKQKRKIIAYVSDLIQLYPTDIFQLKDALENARYFDFIDLERFRTQIIANTSLENDINVQFSKINEKIIQETTKSDELSKELESLLGGKFDSINDFDFATESNTILSNKVDLDLIKHDLLIKEYSSTSVYDFLKIRVGYQPSKSDLAKIEQLAQKYYIPYSAINVLIDYSVFHNIGLNFAYYDAVLKDWYNNSVTSVELAIKYLRSLDVVKSEKVKAKNLNNYKNMSDENNDDLADWYDSLEISTNNMRHEPGQWN